LKVAGAPSELLIRGPAVELSVVDEKANSCSNHKVAAVRAAAIKT
jgi:hypothetical protein